MKKMLCITGIILVACTLITSFYAPQTLAETTAAQTTASTTGYAESEEIYVLKAVNGKIVVYKKGEENPYMTTDFSLSSLPKGDVVYLEKGIEVKGRQKLLRTLEDYGS